MAVVKMRLNGSAGGQEIDSLLYYTSENGIPINPTPTQLLEFGEEWLTVNALNWTNGLPSVYNLNGLTLSVLDLRGVTISPFEVQVPADVPGLQSSNVDTVALCAILRFYTVPNPTEGGRAMKRSYLCYGPLSSDFVLTTGEITGAGIVQLDNALGAVTTPVNTTSFEFSPVRTGRTVAPAPIAVAPVFSATLAPYARWRNSRSLSASGT